MGVLLETKNLTKHFGGVKALQDFNFKLYKSEILGLVGDNGAGKSTFIKTISGVHQPTSGEIYWDGQKIEITSPRMARDLGIETIFQDLSLAENLNVPANIFAGKELCKSYFKGYIQSLDKQKMYKETGALLKRLGVEIENISININNLSGGFKQSIAICRSVYWDAKLIIMDEPTANLDPTHRSSLINLTRKLKSQGITIIFISHNLEDIFTVTDRIVVLREGKKVAELETDIKHEKKVIELIV